MFRYNTLTALVLGIGLAGSLNFATAGESVKPSRPTDRYKCTLTLQQKLDTNPEFAKQVGEAAKSGDKQAVLKLIKPFVPTADVDSLIIEQPTSEHRRVIRIKVVIKGDNHGGVHIPVN